MADKVQTTLQLDADIRNLLAKTKEAQEALTRLGGKAPVGLTRMFGDIEKKLNSLREAAAQPFTSDAQFTAMEKKIASFGVAVKTASDNLKLLAQNDKALQGLLPEDTVQKLNAFQNSMAATVKALKNVSSIQDKINEKTKGICCFRRI